MSIIKPIRNQQLEFGQRYGCFNCYASKIVLFDKDKRFKCFSNNGLHSGKFVTPKTWCIKYLPDASVSVQDCKKYWSFYNKMNTPAKA